MRCVKEGLLVQVMMALATDVRLQMGQTNPLSFFPRIVWFDFLSKYTNLCQECVRVWILQFSWISAGDEPAGTYKYYLFIATSFIVYNLNFPSFLPLLATKLNFQRLQPLKHFFYRYTISGTTTSFFLCNILQPHNYSTILALLYLLSNLKTSSPS